MSFVVDASVAIAWVFADERTPTATGWLESLADRRAIVPAHWALEVANVTLQAQRRRRLDAAAAQAALAALSALPIDTDDGTATRAFREISELAQRHGLSVYDAAYLELAARRRLPLATLDQALVKAARLAGVALHA